MKYKKPDCIKEAIIQAELYVACKKIGLDCDLQYVINPNQYLLPEKYRKETSVFDLVAIVGSEIVAIVEVKATGTPFSLVKDSYQIRKYKKQNVPVFVLYSIYDIPYLVKQLLEVKVKFLESVDSAKTKCFEADRQNEKKWDGKIAAAFTKFDEAFPDYKFTNNQSLEIVATGVKVLGLPMVLKLLEESKGSLAEFFSMLKTWIGYVKGGYDHYLLTAQETAASKAHSISDHQDRQDHINEKLS